MPKVSGKDLMSDTTEKIVRRVVVISAIAILVKAYHIPLQDLKVLGVDLPPALFDVVCLALVVYFTYALIVSWVGDLLAFRVWYRESSIWSEFGTNMKLDKSFIRGGIDLLMKLHHLEKGKAWPADYSSFDEETKRTFQDFKTNVELYAVRLEHAGTKFSLLSGFGHYYVWVQSFLIPLSFSAVAIYLLVKYGTLSLPSQL